MRGRGLFPFFFLFFLVPFFTLKGQAMIVDWTWLSCRLFYRQGMGPWRRQTKPLTHSFTHSLTTAFREWLGEILSSPASPTPPPPPSPLHTRTTTTTTKVHILWINGGEEKSERDPPLRLLLLLMYSHTHTQVKVVVVQPSPSTSSSFYFSPPWALPTSHSPSWWGGGPGLFFLLPACLPACPPCVCLLI